MNPRTLGGLCTTRIGKADIEVASAMVDLYKTPSRLREKPCANDVYLVIC